MADDTIEIEYQLTVEDLAEYSAVRSSGAIKNINERKFLFTVCKMFLLFMLMLLVFSLLVLAFYVQEDFLRVLLKIFKDITETKWQLKDFLEIQFRPNWAQTLILCYLFWVFVLKRIQYFLHKFSAQNMYKSGKNIALLDPKKLIISSKKITNLSEYWNCEYKWSGVEKVEIQNGDFCIFISSVTAIYIPPRFFESEDEKQRIFEQCQKWFLDVQESQEEKADA